MIIKEQIEQTLKFIINIYGITYKDLCQEAIDRDIGDLDEFLINMLGAFDSYDYELYDEHKSNRKNSDSIYYVFIKKEDEKTLKVLVEVRLSDHELPDRTKNGEYVTGTQLANKYLNDEAKKLANSFGKSKGYKKRFINLVMNGIHYNNYEEALQTIEDSLERLG